VGYNSDMRGPIRIIVIGLLALLCAGVLWFVTVLAFLLATDDSTRSNHRNVWSVDMKSPTPAAFRVVMFPAPEGARALSSPDGAELERLAAPILVSTRNFEGEWVNIKRGEEAAVVARRDLELLPPATYFGIETAHEIAPLSESLRLATDDRAHGAAIRAIQLDPQTAQIELYLQHGRNGQCYVYRVNGGTIIPQRIQPYSGRWDGADELFIVTMATIVASLIVAIAGMLWLLLSRIRAARRALDPFDRFGRA